MLANGVIRPSSSYHLSPLLVTMKKNGNLRPCVDYRAINAVTVPDRYPLPRIYEIITKIRGNVFSAIDLTDGFHHIPLCEDDIEMTAVHTPWGSFEFLRMPFGLRNAPASFQRFMDTVCRDLQHVMVYVDDISIFFQQHRRTFPTFVRSV